MIITDRGRHNLYSSLFSLLRAIFIWEKGVVWGFSCADKVFIMWDHWWSQNIVLFVRILTRASKP